MAKDRQEEQPTRRETGDWGEAEAAAFLKKQGWEILARNYTIRGGEIDIIAKKEMVVAFVEVKTRAVGTEVHPIRSINKAKRQALVRSAESFFQKTPPIRDCSGRFDYIIVWQASNGSRRDIQWFPNAFVPVTMYNDHGEIGRW